MRASLNGSANFYLNPLDTALDVDLKIYEEGSNGLIELARAMKAAGYQELITLDVTSNKTYFIEVLHYGSSFPSGANYHLRVKNYPTNGIKKVGSQTMFLNLQNDGSSTTSTINTTKMYIPNDFENKNYRYFYPSLDDSALLSDQTFNTLIQLKNKLFGGNFGKISAFYGEYYVPEPGDNATREQIESGNGSYYFQGLHEGFDMSYYHKCKFYAFGKGKVVWYGKNSIYNLISVKYDSLPGYRVTYLHADSLNPNLFLNADVGTTADNSWLGFQGLQGSGASHVHWEIREDGVGSIDGAVPSLSDTKMSNPNPHPLLSSLL
jgi:murein DD-endopeptidase MepM/ murein hydrolase activator NlpD